MSHYREYIVGTGSLRQHKFPVGCERETVDKGLVRADQDGHQFLACVHIREIREVQVKVGHCPVPNHLINSPALKIPDFSRFSHEQVCRRVVGIDISVTHRKLHLGNLHRNPSRFIKTGGSHAG